MKPLFWGGGVKEVYYGIFSSRELVEFYYYANANAVI